MIDAIKNVPIQSNGFEEWASLIVEGSLVPGNSFQFTDSDIMPLLQQNISQLFDGDSLPSGSSSTNDTLASSANLTMEGVWGPPKVNTNFVARQPTSLTTGLFAMFLLTFKLLG